jgi:hypothetical protein
MTKIKRPATKPRNLAIDLIQVVGGMNKADLTEQLSVRPKLGLFDQGTLPTE